MQPSRDVPITALCFVVFVPACSGSILLEAAGNATSTSAASSAASSSGAGGASTSGSTSTGGAAAPPCSPLGSACTGAAGCCYASCIEGVCGGPAVPACKPGDPPVLLATGMSAPGPLAIDATHVYFVTTAPTQCSPQSTVMRVDKHGGAIETVSVANHAILALAVDGQRVFWGDDPIKPCTKPADPGYSIVGAPTTGGTPTTLTLDAASYAPTDVALDADHVYWVSADTAFARRAPKAGGAEELLLYGGDAPTALVVDGASIYWAGKGGVRSAPKASGPSTQIASFPLGGGYGGLALDTDALFIGAFAACQGADCGVMGFVSRAPLAGGPVQPIANVVEQRPQRLAVDAENVYWTASTSVPGGTATGAVMRAPKLGGSPEMVAVAAAPQGIAVDDACVYWADAADGTVLRLPK